MSWFRGYREAQQGKPRFRADAVRVAARMRESRLAHRRDAASGSGTERWPPVVPCDPDSRRIASRSASPNTDHVTSHTPQKPICHSDFLSTFRTCRKLPGSVSDFQQAKPLSNPQWPTRVTEKSGARQGDQ